MMAEVNIKVPRAGTLMDGELAALFHSACAAFDRLSAAPAGTYAARCETTCVLVLVLRTITTQVGVRHTCIDWS